MTSLRDQLDEIPATIVIAIAYATLAVVTGMFGDPEQLALAMHRFGWLRAHEVATGEPWRLLSYAFLHGGPLHLIVNMVSLWGLGPSLERSLGSVKFVVLYLVAALGGGLAVCIAYDPGQPVVGGSGSLFGMMGGAVAMYMRSGRHALAFLEFEGPRRVLGLIAVNLALGFAIPMVSNTGHIGGLLAGFAVTLLWLDPLAASAARRRWRLAIAALFAGLAFASVMPVTRWDWLWWSATRTADSQRAAALMAAAARSGMLPEPIEREEPPAPDAPPEPAPAPRRPR